MHRFGIKFALNDKISVSKAFFCISHLTDHALGDVGRLIIWFIKSLCPNIVMQNRGIRLHRICRINNMREHFIIYLDQFKRSLCNRVTRRRYCRYGMPVEQSFFPRHSRSGKITRRASRIYVRKIIPRYHGLYTGQRLGSTNIN